jgi:hypothetical protein
MDGAGTTSRRFEVPALPRGWIREEVYRSGSTTTNTSATDTTNMH